MKKFKFHTYHLVILVIAFLILDLFWVGSIDFQLYDTYYDISTDFLIKIFSVILLALVFFKLLIQRRRILETEP